jgi:hypothetical protein
MSNQGSFAKALEQSVCSHEPDMDKKFYKPSGWRAPCAKCGLPLDVQSHLQMMPHTSKKHMSKKERIAIRKMPLFVQEKEEVPVKVDKIRIPKWMRRRNKVVLKNGSTIVTNKEGKSGV